MTTLAEQIFKKQTPGDDKEKFITRSMAIIDEFGIENVISKNSGSRLVQACFKHGNAAAKEALFFKIMKCDLEKILTDNFGKYIVKKILVHLKEKKHLSLLYNYLDSNFHHLLANPNSKIAISDYIESMPESRAIEYLTERFTKDISAEEVKSKVEEIVQLCTKEENGKTIVMGSSLEYFWLYHHWELIEESQKKQLLEMWKEQLDTLIEVKIFGILLYCKLFDYADLKDKTKMLKKCLAKKFDEVLKKNENVLFLFVKIVNSYDDSGNISSIIYDSILDNFYAFVENQTTATFLFYLLCDNFENEFSVKFHPK